MKTQMEMVKEYLLNNYNLMTQYVDRTDNSKQTVYEIIFKTGFLNKDDLSIWLNIERNRVGFEHNYYEEEDCVFTVSLGNDIDSNESFEKLYEDFTDEMCDVFDFDPDEDVNFNESHAELEPYLLEEIENIKKYILNETLKQELKTNPSKKGTVKI